MGSYTIVLADHARTGSQEEVAVAVRALGERVVRTESTALAVSIVRALWVRGLDQADHPRVFDEVHGVLTMIARDARKRSQREIACAALDALAAITAERVGRALPPVGYRIPQKPPVPPPPPARSEAGFFPPPVFPSPLPPDSDRKQLIPAGSRASRRDLLNRFVQSFTTADGVPGEEWTATMAARLARPADSAQTDAPKWWRDYDLLEETADILISLLPSPQPASTGWPAG